VGKLWTSPADGNRLKKSVTYPRGTKRGKIRKRVTRGETAVIQKQFDAIEKTDIEALRDNKVHEGRTLDYKVKLPGNSDGDKKELLADVSSFANAAGGDLLFGIDESEGVPSDIPGLDGVDIDAEILRLDSIIRTGVEPRIPTVQIRPIDGFQQGPVLLVRIPKSWSSPHMVTYSGTSRFYTRNNAGKYQMDVSEIRSAFALSEALPQRIQRFRDDRLAKIIASETPVPLPDAPKMVLHVIPFTAFVVDFRVDPALMKVNHANLFPLGGGGGYSRFNVDGFLAYDGSREDGPTSRRYCQVFRNGVVESVDTDVYSKRKDRQLIASVAYERDVIDSSRQYFQAMIQMAVPPPAVVTLTLIGYKGYNMSENRRIMRYDSTPIDRDLLTLPDVLVEDYQCDVPQLLRPIFDAVWNATGWERSLNYDENGKWNQQ
jgi:hypothetical protein